MNDPINPRQRQLDLFVADLLFGLPEDERAEYEALKMAAEPEELQSLADVIGQLDLTRSEADAVQLPQHMHERIRAAARKELSQPIKEVRREQASFRSSSFLPWTIAAACIVIAIVTLTSYGPFRRPEPLKSPAEMREQFLATAPDVVRADWSAGPTPIPGAAGDISWSTDRQQGYMRFVGMRANDPTVEQYQLWIFDRNQDEKTPVDGGVFDLKSGAEIVVPIRPGLRVREPYLFAVTIEKPGGVVVSDRKRLPLISAVKK